MNNSIQQNAEIAKLDKSLKCEGMDPIWKDNRYSR